MASTQARPKIKTTIRTVTPQLAKQYLKTTRSNRRIRGSRVDRLAQAMTDGEWVVAQPLMFNCDGTMIDGQHRCNGVIEANMPVDFLVCEGFDRDKTFGKIDDTEARKLPHWFECNREPNASTLASVVRMAYIADKGLNPFHSHPRHHLTGPGGVAFLEKNPAIRESVNRGPGVRNRLLPAALCAYLHYEFAKKSKREANRFFVDLTLGEYTGTGDPIYLLHERLKADRSAKEKMPSRQKAALTIKAWNAHRSGTPIGDRGLQWRTGGDAPEKFPTIQ